MAILEVSRVLCEVKTINISKEEADRRHAVSQGHVRAFDVAIHVADGMLAKVSKTLADAIEQLDCEDPARIARRIIFTVIDFDYSIGDYQPEYFADTRRDQHCDATLNSWSSKSQALHPRLLYQCQCVLRTKIAGAGESDQLSDLRLCKRSLCMEYPRRLHVVSTLQRSAASGLENRDIEPTLTIQGASVLAFEREPDIVRGLTNQRGSGH
jgi:hypothetical protein